MTTEKPQDTAEPTGAASALSAGLGRTVKEPYKLNDVAIYIAGLAEVLQAQLDNAQHCTGIDEALNLSWSYKALAELASDLAEQIGHYAP